MPPLLPRGRPSTSRAAEQMQRSNSFPRPIRSHGHRCTCLARSGRREQSGLVTLTFDLLIFKVVS